MGRGAWQATVHRVAKSQTQLKRLSMHARAGEYTKLANRIRPRERTGHSKHPLSITQGRLYTWTSPDGQHRNQQLFLKGSKREK